MDSKTNLNVLLKNLEGFINSVPINPKSPKHREWERTRRVMKKALKDTNEILVKNGYLDGLAVFVGPLHDCRKVLSRQIILAKLPDVIHKAAGQQFKPDSLLKTIKKMR